MLAVPDGVEGLMALNEATEGELYQLLEVCKDEGYTPRLRAISMDDERAETISRLSLFFEGVSEDIEPGPEAMWMLRFDVHPEAFGVALQILLEDSKKAVDHYLALMRAANSTLKLLIERFEREGEPS